MHITFLLEHDGSKWGSLLSIIVPEIVSASSIRFIVKKNEHNLSIPI